MYELTRYGLLGEDMQEEEREQAKRLNDAAEAIRDALNTPADYFGPEE